MATKPSAPPRYPLENGPDGRPRFRGCAKVAEYQYICKLGEGTFGEVSKAKSKTGQVVALKKILVHNEKDGFPITALREIKLLKQLDHPNVLKMVEMAVERPKDVTKKSNMFMVTPYMSHDLSGLLKNPNIHFTEPQTKCYMKQLLEGCKYLHESRILHRDMKAANLLIDNRGVLQIADFGLARPYDDAPPQRGRGGGEATRNYTTLVVTRWYRPPELLLQLRNYTTAIDMWGVGCVFGEIFKRKPILQGDSDLKQAQMIFQLVGSPNDHSMPGWQELPGCEGVKDFGFERGTIEHQFRDLKPQALSLLREFLTLDWRKRINAMDALDHPYFHTEPLPCRPEDIPFMEDSHEFDKQRPREGGKPPPAPAGGAVGIGPPNEYGFEARRPYDRGPGRNNRRTDHPHGQPRRGPPQNGDYDYRGGRGPRDRPPYDRDRDRDFRPPQRGYDDPPYDRDNRRPPMHRDPASFEETHSRRPYYPPDTSLPPRPPIPDDPYANGGSHPYRDRDDPGGPPNRGPPRRVPPGAPVDGPSRLPPGARQSAPEVDTYIPSYSNADPNARPPRIALSNPDGRGPNRRPPPPPPRDRDYDSRPGSRGARGPSADYDDSLRYDDGGLNGNDEAYRSARGPSSTGSYDRRRSRSPMRIDRGPDRDRDRDPYGGDPNGRYGNGRPPDPYRR